MSHPINEVRSPETLEKAVELVERVMTLHWDIIACGCVFCRGARAAGMRPRLGYPTRDPLFLDPDADRKEMRKALTVKP